MARKTEGLGRRAVAHRVEPLVARPRCQFAAFLVGQRACRVKDRGNLVGVAFVKAVEVGLHCKSNGYGICGHALGHPWRHRLPNRTGGPSVFKALSKVFYPT